jgi:hypothetical protein
MAIAALRESLAMTGEPVSMQSRCAPMVTSATLPFSGSV